MRERIEVVEGDITKVRVDAVVNAANQSLRVGGGVDGAIHRAAGRELTAETSTFGGCPTGEARISGAYRLPATYVIHAVGPRWRGGNHGEAALLASAYRNSLALAASHDCHSVAFPAISTGVYGYPLEAATRIAVAEVQAFLAEHDLPQTVIFVCYTSHDAAVYRWVVDELIPA
ncbi:MAG: O-acetyl-ADP-ribose deacetylase [Ktedonobacterales bacterium]|nr:O-acetyl-ADP-ribose deacetylase [Ktedonobacterales bacterium]